MRKSSKGWPFALSLQDLFKQRKSESTTCIFSVGDGDGDSVSKMPSANEGNTNPCMTDLVVPRIVLPQDDSLIVSFEPEQMSPSEVNTCQTEVFHMNVPQENESQAQRLQTNVPRITVPQINLKRRESGYESDLAILALQKFRTSSTNSSSSCPSSPLLLSVKDLRLQDDDAISSLSLSMTSLSGSSSTDSQSSSDSGHALLKNRRSVSFSEVDTEMKRSKKKEYYWEMDDQSSAARRKFRSQSFSPIGHSNRLQHSGSFNSLGLLHEHYGCVNPLGSSRCRSVSSASLSSTVSGMEFGGAIFAVKLFNRIGRKVDGSNILSNVSHVHHVYKGMTLLTDILEEKITVMNRNGRFIKEFVTEKGSEPRGACVTPKGHVAVTLRRQSCVTVWSGHGSLVREFGHDILKCPTGLACDQRGRFVVTDEGTNRVAIFIATGKFLRYLHHRNNKTKHDTATQNSSKEHISSEQPQKSEDRESKLRFGQLLKVGRLTPREKKDADRKAFPAKDGNGNFTQEYGTDNNRLNRLTASPRLTTLRRRLDANTTIRNQSDMNPNFSKTDNQTYSDSDNNDNNSFKFSDPRYVCVTSSGKIVASDSGSHSVKVFTSDGEYLRSIGQHGNGDGHLKVPYGVCCDHAENIYVADHYNDRISVFSIEGEFLQHLLTSSSGLSRPKSVALRSAHDQELYVARGGLRATEAAVYTVLSGRRHSVAFKYDV